jgi:transcriptional regulatory protein LevR
MMMPQCEYEFQFGEKIAYCINEMYHTGPHETDIGNMMVLDEMTKVSEEQWQPLKRIAKPDGSASATAMIEEIKRLLAEGAVMQGEPSVAE